MLTPIELAAVDDHATNGGTMTSNPFCCAVDDDVSAMVDGAAEKTTSSKGIVNLERYVRL